MDWLVYYDFSKVFKSPRNLNIITDCLFTGEQYRFEYTLYECMGYKTIRLETEPARVRAASWCLDIIIFSPSDIF